MSRIIFLSLCVLLLMSAAGIQAQAPDAPLIYASAGDLWRYDFTSNTATNITGWGYNAQPIFNARNGLIAYNSTARLFVEAIRAGEGFSGAIGTNIWIINPTNGDGERLADQPENASLEDFIYVSRSDPSWSADGAQLAWTEYQNFNGADEYFVVIYDTVTQSSEKYPLNLQNVYGVPSPLPVLWSHDGQYLAVRYSLRNPASEQVTDVIDFYNTAMSRVNQIEVTSDTFAHTWQWMTHQGGTVLGAYLGNDTWNLFNPVTGATEVYTGAIRGTVDNPAPAGLNVLFDGDVWEVEYPSIARETLPYTGTPLTLLQNIALSPDGQSLAFADTQDQLTVMNAGGTIVSQTVVDAGINGIVWGEMRWQTDSFDPGTPSLFGEDGNCNQAPPPLIQVGMTVVTNVSGTLALRGTPIDENAADQLDGDTELTVVAGPVCHNGYRWWQIETQKAGGGWVSEGAGQDYFIVPLTN